MKKLIMAAVLAASVVSGAFAAGEEKVSRRVMNGFSKEFGNISNITWTAKEDFTRATFVSDGENVEAFFDADGSLIGTSRTITLEELPAASKRAFAKKYPGYSVKEVIQFNDKENNAYYISAENANDKVIFKINAGSVSVFKKSSKN